MFHMKKVSFFLMAFLIQAIPIKTFAVWVQEKNIAHSGIPVLSNAIFFAQLIGDDIDKKVHDNSGWYFSIYDKDIKSLESTVIPVELVFFDKKKVTVLAIALIDKNNNIASINGLFNSHEIMNSILYKLKKNKRLDVLLPRVKKTGLIGYAGDILTKSTYSFDLNGSTKAINGAYNFGLKNG